MPLECSVYEGCICYFLHTVCNAIAPIHAHTWCNCSYHQVAKTTTLFLQWEHLQTQQYYYREGGKEIISMLCSWKHLLLVVMYIMQRWNSCIIATCADRWGGFCWEEVKHMWWGVRHSRYSTIHLLRNLWWRGQEG